MFRSGNSDLSMQRMIDPAKAGVKIKQALKEASGNVTAAARKLGVSKMTLYRWVRATPGLEREVRKMREETSR